MKNAALISISATVAAAIVIIVAESSVSERRGNNIARPASSQEIHTVGIDRDSLLSTSRNPVISGTAKGVNTVAILVYPSGPKAYDYGSYGMFQGASPVRGGRWSFQIGGSSDLKNSGLTIVPAGTYAVDVREFTGVVPADAGGLAVLLSGEDLASGTLIVKP